ncbi:molecular chaperone DnaK [Candidatus Jorgensenbacteria bacterium CG_4_10_14_0_8_um_filter_39_13]|uniref:Chaperone protein DnaK n=1 Tax=Candidatus Jorgensenbacteria bacterium CG_4_10_14_0_8_um_filter_39_13 TaxID=1974589 RepID=A0A2M7RJ16_9BACT|nr:MAG: molecular chaperone DnaK [Candidatus Jorgensenbacteria bacterium CG03_land_8_20_14_0_80_38_39]PIW97730.1 MAG: molecular chaperone DnaK [Candidatus Jorgensenbacteria bacterium CG_4_8_14_3_um_filter_38_10]PIY96461.1 MAG: molecular chaperone DnaK [Candidatus Jorgensenbacteria bacterium CG_4_10_14_0_8_um_filter_39_13]
MSKILGIDLGTTYSAVAVVEGGEPRILENQEGGRITPSIVALSKSGERLVGLLAKRQSVTNPKNTIFSVKRLIGRKFKDPTVVQDKQWLSYELRESSSGGVEIKMGDPSTSSGQVPSTSSGQVRWYKPEEISAMVLQKLKADAEAKLGQKVEEAVITVPAYFDDSQRQATKNAGEIAGFKVRRIINEPTAAALAYGLNRQKNEKIVVYDFGGGTFDISILEVGDDTVEVKATGGDTHLGGDDFDKKIIEYLVGEYRKQEGIDISKDPLALQRLKEAAERAKHELSTAVETEINLPYITSDSSGPKHFLMKLTRAKLEELTHEFIDRSIALVKEVVTSAPPKGAGLKFSEIDEVVLVGGQTRMPAIQEAVRKLFNKEPHKGINPDEVVAVGAAIQAGILQGDVRDILLLDVTPLTLGIETLGGVATPMISKNTTIPTSKTQIFSTAADSQSSVEIHITQGERPMVADNKTLARFLLDGIPPAPRGIPQIEVTFDIDANGILNVSAKDKATGKTQSVRIEATTSLNKEEVEKLKREAELYAAEDQKKRELTETKNQAETLVYSAEKALKENADKIPPEIKEEINQRIKDLREIKEPTDAEKLKQAVNDLSSALQKIGQAMYGQQPKPEDNNPPNNSQA